MGDGKKMALYNGFTFFFSDKTRKSDLWLCSCFPKCKAFLRIDMKTITIKSKDVKHTHRQKILLQREDGEFVNLIE